MGRFWGTRVSVVISVSVNVMKRRYVWHSSPLIMLPMGSSGRGRTDGSSMRTKRPAVSTDTHTRNCCR